MISQYFSRATIHTIGSIEGLPIKITARNRNDKVSLQVFQLTHKGNYYGYIGTSCQPFKIGIVNSSTCKIVITKWNSHTCPMWLKVLVEARFHHLILHSMNPSEPTDQTRWSTAIHLNCMTLWGLIWGTAQQFKKWLQCNCQSAPTPSINKHKYYAPANHSSQCRSHLHFWCCLIYA